MLKTISKMKVRLDKTDEFVELFQAMVEPTKKEKGCIQYEMYQDLEDPAVFIALEQWENREAFDNHLKSKHFETIGSKMMELMSAESEINLTYKIV